MTRGIPSHSMGREDVKKTSPFVINDNEQIYRSAGVIIHHHTKGRLALSQATLDLAVDLDQQDPGINDPGSLCSMSDSSFSRGSHLRQICFMAISRHSKPSGNL